MIEVKEILRLWLEGRSLREITRLVGVDRKTVRRYVDAGQACGLDRAEGTGQLTDVLLGLVVGVVRPERAARLTEAAACLRGSWPGPPVSRRYEPPTCMVPPGGELVDLASRRGAGRSEP